jgi:HlyD family secretion protein
MKKFMPFILLAVVLSLLGWRIWQAKHFAYAGTVEAETVDISPGVASPIQGFDVAEGDTVKEGQLLVRLSCEDIRIQAGQVATDFNRSERLFLAGSAPKANYDSLNYKNRDAALKLSWCDIRAPRGGTVLNIYRQAGEWVRPGQALLTLADLGKLNAVFYVPQTLLASLKLGQAVNATLPELPGKVFTGKLVHIRQEAEFTPKNVQTREQRERLVYGIKVAFDNPDGVLKPGMTLETKLP